MSRGPRSASSVRARAASMLVLALAGAALLHSGLALRLPVLCFFRRVTSLPCPSCGMTRAMAALTHGNLRGAMAHNAGVWLVALLALGAAALMLLELLTGRAWVQRVWAIRGIRTAAAVLAIATMSVAWVQGLVHRFSAAGHVLARLHS